MKNYTVYYDVVSSIDQLGTKKVTGVVGKNIKIENADGLDLQSAVAALESLSRDAISITSASSEDVL